MVHLAVMQCSGPAQGLLISRVLRLVIMGNQEGEPNPYGSHNTMELFIFSIPLMVLAVGLAVLPLILMSHAESRQRSTEVISRSRWVSNEDGAFEVGPRA